MPKTIQQYEPQSIGTGGRTGWSASGQSTLVIGARAFVISGLLLDFEFQTYDSTPVVQQDFWGRAVQSLSLIGDGKNYVNINGPDLRSLYWHTRLASQGRFRRPDYSAGGFSGSPLSVRYVLPLILTPHPVKFDDEPNWFGQKAGIITSDDLTLQINWNTAAIWGTGSSITIKNGYCAVTYLGYVPANDSEKPKYYPFMVSQQNIPTSTFPGLSYLAPVPVGAWYRRSTLMTVNGVVPADVRSNGTTANAISEVGIQTADGRNPIRLKVPAFAAASQTMFEAADDNTEITTGAAASYGVAVTTQRVNPGVGQIDWTQVSDLDDKQNTSPDYGINLIGKDPSALQLAATVDVATNTNLIVLHERYAPYSS